MLISGFYNNMHVQGNRSDTKPTLARLGIFISLDHLRYYSCAGFLTQS